MTKVIIKCTKNCPTHSYSRSLGRCKLGYVNPPTKKAVISCINLMGINYVCSYNRFKSQALQEMRERMSDHV